MQVAEEKARNPRKKQRTGPKSLVIYYDFECIQTRPNRDNPKAYEHEVILCVSHKVCPDCMEVPDSVYDCVSCGPREKVFLGGDPVENFIKYLQTFAHIEKVTLLGHNAKAYDLQFIYKTMLEKFSWTPTVIMNGTKIIQLVYDKLRFLDSYSFIPVALSKFVPTFGLDSNLNKGYFCHLLFNVVDHPMDPKDPRANNYVLESSMPPLAAYDPDRFGEGDRAKLVAWYDEQVQAGTGFNFVEELVRYCKQDVYILRVGCVAFAKMFMEIGGVSPFESAVTIAGVCNAIFRKTFLKPNSIGIVPPGGYRLADHQSVGAIEWLKWEEHKRGIVINSAFNGREPKILNIKVDGLHDRTVFQYHGCFWHGCVDCFKTHRSKVLHGDPTQTMAARYASTLRTTYRLRELGYTVVEMWECKFMAQRKANPDINVFVKDNVPSSLEPLDPRDAFFGGRTSALTLYYKVKPGEKLRYADVTSLYPYVNKAKKLPLRHPKIYTSNFPPLDTMDGLVKAELLPPTNLYHPVLPQRINGKLIFALCTKCAVTRNMDDCTHSDSERTIKGTWVTDEVQKAVSLGYQLTKVLELWQYETTQYDRVTGQGGLFVEYINCFLKVKQESSGWPAGVTSEEDKAKYLADYKTNEGVTLDPARIQKNPGLRTISNLALNSFCGKFGQRIKLTKHEVINEPQTLLHSSEQRRRRSQGTPSSQRRCSSGQLGIPRRG